MSAELNLTIEQNATYSRTVAIQNAGGSAYDLTGCTVAAMIRRVYHQTTPPDEEFTITYDADRTTGLLTISLTAAETQALSFRQTYYWDMLLTTAAGTNIRCCEGSVTVDASVTHT